MRSRCQGLKALVASGFCWQSLLVATSSRLCSWGHAIFPSVSHLPLPPCGDTVLLGPDNPGSRLPIPRAFIVSAVFATEGNIYRFPGLGPGIFGDQYSACHMPKLKRNLKNSQGDGPTTLVEPVSAGFVHKFHSGPGVQGPGPSFPLGVPWATWNARFFFTPSPAHS